MPAPQPDPGAPGGPAKKAGTPHSTVLLIGLELLFGGILVILAGVSDQTGKMVTIFLVALWITYMVIHPAVFTRIGAAIQTAGTNA